MFVKRQINDITILEIPAFAATDLVHHGFSTRIGGYSKAPFDTLDVGIYNQDDLTDVQANRIAFAQAIGIAPEKVVSPHQVHGTNIIQVGHLDCGKGFLTPDTAIEDTDALMTNEPGVGLMACFADCTPLFFLDTDKKAIAISHAGWKGTVAEIGPKTIGRMHQAYGSRAQDILVGIGPAIGPCHYEVDTPVIEQIRQQFDFWPQVLHFTDTDKAKLDLWQLNRLQLLAVGVKAEHITISQWCTYCHPALFYSYRRDQGQTGRMAALMSLKEERS